MNCCIPARAYTRTKVFLLAKIWSHFGEKQAKPHFVSSFAIVVSSYTSNGHFFQKIFIIFSPKNYEMLEYLLEFWLCTSLLILWLPFCFSIFSNPLGCWTIFYLTTSSLLYSLIFSSWIKKNSSERSRDFVVELGIFLTLDVNILLNPIVNNFYEFTRKYPSLRPLERFIKISK